ncbi:MAG TPA: M48 family metallopeptidase [Candidatus Acidoferrales bacterium]|nr:M48 family metallopeptidase [Candidatus Acidoferrales bacterium]
MDFFDRQERARKHTKLLEVYFGLAIMGISTGIYFAVVLLLNWWGVSGHRRYDYDSQQTYSLWDAQLFLTVAAITLVFILCGSAYKMVQLSRGGKVVAEMLGGRLVPADTSDPNERKLLNVVEEMAIASGTPVPPVYVLDGERGINAFAAGHSTSDMVICVTRGSLSLLTRDELQGVMGHEFSHILNGDMRLNLHLMGLVFGILYIALFGGVLLRTRGSRNPLPLAGAVLWIIGYIGWVFATLIKSAVNRAREFLADAAAVQFTRNAGGLAGALKKVGGSGSLIIHESAEDVSHMFFANGMRDSFARFSSTHPPLEERIRALEPGWDGQFTAPPDDYLKEAAEVASQRYAEAIARRRSSTAQVAEQAAGAALGVAVLPSAHFVSRAGTPITQHLEYAADLRSQLPEELSGAAREPAGAVALIYALLLNPNEAARAQQLAKLQQTMDAEASQRLAALLPVATGLESRARLPLALLALTGLRRLSPDQYLRFKDNLNLLTGSDGQTDLFRYALQKILRRHLDSNFGPPRKPVVQYYTLKPVVADCAVLISALARAGPGDSNAVEAAFLRGAQQMEASELKLLDASACRLNDVDAALDRLNQASPLIKKGVLTACAETVAADGAIQENEAELLRAIADTLDCPIPPFLTI